MFLESVQTTYNRSCMRQDRLAGSRSCLHRSITSFIVRKVFVSKKGRLRTYVEHLHTKFLEVWLSLCCHREAESFRILVVATTVEVDRCIMGNSYLLLHLPRKGIFEIGCNKFSLNRRNPEEAAKQKYVFKQNHLSLFYR